MSRQNISKLPVECLAVLDWLYQQPANEKTGKPKRAGLLTDLINQQKNITVGAFERLDAKGFIEVQVYDPANRVFGKVGQCYSDWFSPLKDTNAIKTGRDWDSLFSKAHKCAGAQPDARSMDAEFAAGQSDNTDSYDVMQRMVATLSPRIRMTAGGLDSMGNQDADLLNGLSDRKRNIIQVLQERKAFDCDSRVDTHQIAHKVEGQTVIAGNFKHDISDLRTGGLIEAKRGYGGGNWLTPLGRRLAEKLR